MVKVLSYFDTVEVCIHGEGTIPVVKTHQRCFFGGDDILSLSVMSKRLGKQVVYS